MNKRLALLSTAFALALIGSSTTAQAGPPSWVHGHRVTEVREHHYVYYPAQRVYYAPATQSWFWMNGGNWQVGVNLPRQFQLSANVGGLPVMLQSSRPYTEHIYVEETYGRPWRKVHYHEEKHRHKHKRRHKHEHKHRHYDHDHRYHHRY